MKTKILKLVAIFIMIISIAQAVEANVEIGETGPYDKVNGKKLLIYGDEVFSIIEIAYWNANNISQKTTLISSINSTKYVYQININTSWNATYIFWSINVIATTLYHFEGGFSTIESNTVESINLSKFRELVTTYSERTDSTISSTKSSIIDTLSTTIGTYNEGLVTRLQSVGLTDTQSVQLASIIEESFDKTLKTHNEQLLAEAEQYNKGYNDAIRYLIIFIAIVIVLLIIFALQKGLFTKVTKIKIKRSFKHLKSPSESSFDLDTFLT